MPLGRFGAELIPAGGISGRVKMDRKSADYGTWTADPPKPPAGSFLMEVPPDPELPGEAGEIVFGEVYWADIPRGPAAHRYTLDEAKKWAQSIVERLRELLPPRASGAPVASKLYPDRFYYPFARTVIGQLAEGIGVLGRLLWLGEKAGLPPFKLDDLLVNYLGDVQVFTEFQNYRRQILDTFHDLMRGIHDRHPDATIYVVAHSEGSVIAFLAMLEALRGVKGGIGQGAGEALNANWASKFGGLMTIGAPIGKHLVLWDWLWKHLNWPDKHPRPDLPRIPWRNYYDYGDPVGFGLRDTRRWLDQNGWKGVFDFDHNDQGDIAFTRYPFPGKAHTDYWNDGDVFDHFLGTVVWPGTRRAGRAAAAPRTRLFYSLVSRCLPYLLVLAVLLLGAYLLHKGSAESYGIESSPTNFARDLAATTILLAGVTAVVRVPRLTSELLWVVGALLLFAASLYAFPHLISDDQRVRLWMSLSRPLGDEVRPMFNVPATTAAAAFLAVLFGLVAAYAGVRESSERAGTAGAADGGGGGGCREWSSPWLRPAVFLGVAVVLGIVFWLLMPPAWTATLHDWKWDLEMYPATATVLTATVVLALVAYCLDLFLPSWGVKSVVVLGSLILFADIADTRRNSGTFAKYQTVKEEAARRMGLQGAPLDEASIKILLTLAANDPKFLEEKEHSLRERARREAMKLREDCEFSGKVQPFVPGTDVVVHHGDANPWKLWPFLLSCAAFFYLWWLAALLLDLTVVWHHFIKGEALLKQLPPLQPPLQPARQAET